MATETGLLGVARGHSIFFGGKFKKKCFFFTTFPLGWGPNRGQSVAIALVLRTCTWWVFQCVPVCSSVCLGIGNRSTSASKGSCPVSSWIFFCFFTKLPRSSERIRATNQKPFCCLDRAATIGQWPPTSHQFDWPTTTFSIAPAVLTRRLSSLRSRAFSLSFSLSSSMVIELFHSSGDYRCRCKSLAMADGHRAIWIIAGRWFAWAPNSWSYLSLSLSLSLLCADRQPLH